MSIGEQEYIISSDDESPLSDLARVEACCTFRRQQRRRPGHNHRYFFDEELRIWLLHSEVHVFRSF